MALPRYQRLAAAVVAGIAVAGLGACGGATDTAAPSTTAGPTTTGVATGSAPTTTVVVAPTTVATGRVLEYAFAGGAVTGDGRVSVKLGEQVTIRVVSDVAEEVHVHTYDVAADLGPGLPGGVTFVADIPGVHEVELEGSHLRLLSLEVQ